MKVAILGYGTVGSGVFEVLTENAEIIAKRVGKPIEIKYVLDLREFPGDPVEKVLTHNFEDIIQDPEVEILVEVMGGLKPAYDFTKRALLSGRSVCTSNKELVAKHGAELIRIAQEKDCNYLFEASVGGGIPVIRQLIRSITADEVEKVEGILNGTTNYMMTQMRENGTSFDDVLKDAQAKGYAERNPAADIEGHDACRKIAILTSLAYGRQVDYEDIYTEGITGISDVDVAYANKLGRGIKLLGESYRKDGTVYAMVAPKMILSDNPLYPVNGVFNAILIRGNKLDDVMCYGRGAGKLPTASAVVSDVIDAAKHPGKNIPILWEEERIVLGAKKDMENAFFFRVPAANKAAAIAALPITETIELPEYPDEVAFITQRMTEGAFAEKSAALGVINMVRAEA